LLGSHTTGRAGQFCANLFIIRAPSCPPPDKTTHFTGVFQFQPISNNKFKHLFDTMRKMIYHAFQFAAHQFFAAVKKISYPEKI